MITFPDRIERTVTLARQPRDVWPALTTAEGLSAWFGEHATIDLRPGGAATMTFAGGMTVEICEFATVWDDGTSVVAKVDNVHTMW